MDVGCVVCGSFVGDNVGAVTNGVTYEIGVSVGAPVSDLDEATGATVADCGLGQAKFSKHTVPDGHIILSSTLQVCNAYEHDDMTSDKLDAQ